MVAYHGNDSPAGNFVLPHGCLEGCRTEGVWPMSLTAVSHCSQCGAMVNTHWPCCLVCHGALPSSIQSEIPSQTVESKSPVSAAPIPPLQPGWLVTYQDQAGKLCGGSEERAHGTVQECRWDAGRWTVCLTDGRQMPLWIIRAVGQTDQSGRVCAAWTVREHGYDGRKREDTP